MSGLFDSVDDSEDIFSSSKSTSSPPPPLSSETDVSVTAGGDDVRESVNGTCNDDEKMAKEGESNEELGNAVKDEGINEEGHGGNKDKKDESNEHPGDPLTSALMSNEGSNEGSEGKKFESSPENEEIFKESDDKESPVSDPLLNQPTTKHNDLFSEDTVDTSLFGSATSSSRSTNMFPYATGDDDLFKETTTRQEKQEMNKKDEDKDREEIEGEVNESGKEETPQHDDDETVKVKNTVAVEDEFVVVTSDEVPPQEEVEHAMQQREIARKKSQEENDKLVSEEKTKVYSDGLSYDERAALRKHKREQRKLQTTTGTKTTEKSSKSATTYRSDLKTKPQKLPTKPSPKPSPNIGRRAASTTSLKIDQARTDSHSTGTGTDPQEQIHQLTSKLHKAQSELTREKKKLESLLAEERSKVKQLERTIASKDAEIADLKRKAKEHQKQSTSITRPKKGDSPGITRKISDSSPRSLKRVGSGEKGTPTGSPAELRKHRSGVTRETTSSVADTRKKFIKTTTTSSETKRKTRLSSKSEEGEETKVSKDKPPPGPKKETTPVPAKPSKPAPPVKSDRIKSPVPAKTEKPTPTEEDKSTTNTTNSAQLFRTTPSPIHIQQTSKGKAPTLTSDPLSTPPVGEDRVKSPITTDSPTTIVEASKDESSVSTTTNMTSVIAESPPENGVTDDQEDISIPRALQLISTFERKSSQHAQQNTQPWKRKKTGNDEEVSAPSPDKESRSVSPQQEIHSAGSPQLAPGPQKDTEKENDVKKTTVEVAVTEVPLREKILKKSVSNTSTTGENKPGLSLFDNRTKRSSWMSQQKEECEVCKTTVYAMERLEADKLVYHKTCFKCSVCSKTLGVGTYAALQGVIYCKVHFKQLFKMKGNYDEGFGREQHKTKWSKKETQ